LLLLLFLLNEGGSKSYELGQQLEWLKSSSGLKLDSSWSSNIDLDCKCCPLVNRSDDVNLANVSVVLCLKADVNI